MYSERVRAAFVQHAQLHEIGWLELGSAARRGGYELVPPPYVRGFDRECVHGLVEPPVDGDDERVADLLEKGLETDSMLLQVPPQSSLYGHLTFAQFADPMPAYNRGIFYAVVHYGQQRTDEHAEV